MGTSGDYPKTVLLQQPELSGESDFGHEQFNFVDVRKCAARLWVRSSAEIAGQPADFTSSTLRLLLRLPPAELAVGWGIVFETAEYLVSAADVRDDDILVTLEPR